MNAAASSWISILEWVRGKSQIDQIRSAKIQLRASVECLESSEKEIKADLSKIASKVKAAPCLRGPIRKHQGVVRFASSQPPGSGVQSHLSSRERQVVQIKLMCRATCPLERGR